VKCTKFPVITSARSEQQLQPLPSSSFTEQFGYQQFIGKQGQHSQECLKQLPFSTLPWGYDFWDIHMLHWPNQQQSKVIFKFNFCLKW